MLRCAGAFVNSDTLRERRSRLTFAMAPSPSKDVNLLEVDIEKAVSVGPSMTLHARAANGERLVLTAPKHVLARRGVTVGEAVRVRLAPRAIHLMSR